jgi:ribosomal protein L37E
MRTWKVINWPDKPKDATNEQWVSLDCERCGREAECPVIDAPLVIGAKGMGIFFDSTAQPSSRPLIIQCRNCGRQYVREDI